MDDFHMVLPSSVHNLAGGINHPGHYTTYLNTPITLDRDHWKVAALEITLSNCWFNISQEIAHIQFGTIVEGQNPGDDTIFRDIRVGYYSGTEGLLESLNHELHVGGSKIRFSAGSMGPRRPRVVLNIPVGEYIILHPALCDILGFPDDRHCGFVNTDEDESGDNLQFVADRSCDANRSLQNIYVYCNIIKAIVVGDSTVPILRVFPANADQHSTIIHHEFTLPHYRALETGDLSVIEIKLCDKHGNILSFHEGDVVIQLHFKRF